MAHHTPTTRNRPGLLGRTGRFIARHHRWVALVWVLVLLGGGYLGVVDKKSVSDDFRIPDTDSQAAYDLLNTRFPSQNGATATVVFEAPDGSTVTDAASADAISAAVSRMEKLPGVASVSNPVATAPSEAIDRVAGSLPSQQKAELDRVARSIPSSVSEDGRIAYATVTYEDSPSELLKAFPPNPDEQPTAYTNPYSQLDESLDDVRSAGVEAYVGGAVADNWNNPVSWWANNSELVGLLVGAVLLFLAFGSLWGMAIPISTALFGAVTASGLVYLLGDFTTVSSAAPAVTLMISIGVGLDYSLLIVTRYRQFVDDGHDPVDAVGDALQTAGKAAVFAGLTVCIALLGLLVVPIPLVATLGLSAAIGVGVMILAATTFLPALLGFAGARIDSVGLPYRHGHDVDTTRSGWGRFAGGVTRRAWWSLVGGAVVLVLLALPFARIDFGMPDDGSLSPGLSQRTAFELLQEGFGPGVDGPLIVAVGVDGGRGLSYRDALTTLRPVSEALGALEPRGTIRGVESSVGPIPNSADRTTAVIYAVTPTTSPDAPATTELVERLRSDLARATAGTELSAHVGGPTATLIDLTDEVTKYLPIVIGAVVLGAFVLLVLVFRSLLVPLKAAVLNLLSIGAAYGVVVAVFQWGWARQLVGISETIPIVSFVPLVMFVILFGLSMDYEVFLMSRMKEEWDRTGDPDRSVVLGVAHTGRVITTAALIMIAVFMSFVTNANPTVKLIGFGMAVAVLIDSTIVRMVLVPAVMKLLGARAWWFPSWLGWLPRLDVEGTAPPEPTDAGSTADSGDRPLVGAP